MKILISHIEYLLTENDCVIVPGWGGFVVQQHHAMITETSILPPFREVCFNPGLVHDDGILISSISQARGISYTEARRLLNNEIGIFNADLSLQKNILFGKIGQFSCDEDNTLIFESNLKSSVDIDSLGFAPLQMKTLEEIQVKQQPVTARKPFAEQEGDIIHIRVSKRKMLRAMASTAAILILWVFSSPVNDQRANVSCAGIVSQIELAKVLSSKSEQAVKKDTVQKADTAVVVKAEKPVAKKDTVAVEVERYFIVLGSFHTEKAAERHCVQLKDEGIANVQVKKMGSKMRSYLKGFVDKDEAMKYLNKIRNDREEYKEAWLYCLK